MQGLLFVASFVPAVFFPLAAVLIGLRNPSIFNLSLISGVLPVFLAVSLLLAFPVIRTLLQKASWTEADIPGFILFLLFGCGYFLLATLFNRPDRNTNNIYFAADSWSWYLRMGSPEGWTTGVRAVHPLAHLIFRPAVALISVLTHGDRFSANLVLLALTGGTCVFLMWKIVRKISGNDNYSILVASLLGLSASHLIFASVIESYIFSAACLLLFIWLLLSNKSVYLLIVTAILTLGITLTNIAQQALMAWAIQGKLRRVIVLFSTVVVLGAGCNMVGRLLYPVTEYFFLPQNLAGEARFAQEINLKRIGLTAENIFIYNVAAPEPYTNSGRDMLRFNFLNGTIINYVWFGWSALLLWIACLSLAFYRFAKNLRGDLKGQSLSIFLLACLAFNFLLHVGYGTEPFLYSADWTYALVLFIAISLKDFAEQTWFKLAMLVFIMALFLNNLWLLYFVARGVSKFLA